LKLASGGLAGDFVWLNPAVAVTDENPVIMISKDGERWKELPRPAPPAVAGSVPLPEAVYMRAMQRKDGETVFGDVLRYAEVLYASTAALDKCFVHHQRDAAMKPSAAPPVWRALTAAEQPGAAGWTADYVLNHGEAVSFTTASLRFDPGQKLLFSGWVRVECEAPVSAMLTVETMDAEGQAASGLENRAVALVPGAWRFFPRAVAYQPAMPGARKTACGCA